MSERKYTDDSDTDESDEVTLDKKALPWNSTALDVVSKGDSSEEEALSSASSTSSLPVNDIKNISIKDKALSKQLSSLDVDKLPTNSVVNNSPWSSPATKSNNKPDNTALPWEDNVEDVQMKDPPIEINLLLLGESGVGKSTFINSFANYMKHENFEAVQQNNLSVLIPARFHIFDKEFKKHLIEMGANDDNEHLVDGAAATQDVKTYVFYITLENKLYLIRLVDTPGMGDPRGIDQDNKNCDYVLNYLGRLEKIHAICLLLKPTNTRLDVFLNYCITQILSRLEKSATDNIAFLFTNTRGQNYTPGDTYTSLELLVKKIKDTNNVTLPLSHKNVFCFDNEAFRFLASIKRGVEFKEGVLEANIESWKYSYKEIYRLISYIVQLKPHDPQKTISINHARKMVLQLSQPLADIVQLIGDNIYQLGQHTNQLLMENQTLDELKQKLHMPVIDIRVKELTQPVTVCTAPQCSTIYKVADKNKFHYEQRCHNPCYLNNVPAEIVGDPHLLECWAMTKSTQTCHQCGCRFNTHMHIYYETDTFENKIVDQNVLKNIKTKKDATREKEKMINKVLDVKSQLEKEHKHIIKCSAEFAHFLQQNAITPVNDSLREYVKYLITREENLGPEANRATLDYLRRLLAEYEQQKSVLEEALKQTSASAVTNLSASTIESKIKELFTLPNFGKKIKQLYDLHQTGGLREHKQSEFVVKERYKLSIVDTIKSWIPGLGGKSKHQKRAEMERQRALEYERFLHHQYYGYSQQHRQEFVPRIPHFQFNESYGDNPYFFGPNAPRSLYSEWEAQSWNTIGKKHMSNSERQHQRNQFSLEYNGRNIDHNLRYQYFQNSENDDYYPNVAEDRRHFKSTDNGLENNKRRQSDYKCDTAGQEIAIRKDQKKKGPKKTLDKEGCNHVSKSENAKSSGPELEASEDIDKIKVIDQNLKGGKQGNKKNKKNKKK